MKNSILKFAMIFCLLILVSVSNTHADGDQEPTLKFIGYAHKMSDGRSVGLVKAFDPAMAIIHPTVVEILAQTNTEWTIEKRSQEVAKRMSQVYKENPEFYKILGKSTVNGEIILTWDNSGKWIVTADKKSADIYGHITPDEYANVLIRTIQKVLGDPSVR